MTRRQKTAAAAAEGQHNRAITIVNTLINDEIKVEAGVLWEPLLSIIYIHKLSWTGSFCRRWGKYQLKPVFRIILITVVPTPTVAVRNQAGSHSKEVR